VRFGRKDFSNILQQFSSSDDGITIEGFKELIRYFILEYGEETVWNWFRSWGFDEYLFSG